MRTQSQRFAQLADAFLGLADANALDPEDPRRLREPSAHAVEIEREAGRVFQLEDPELADLAVRRDADPGRAVHLADRDASEPVRGVLHLLHVLAREHEVGIRRRRLRFLLADREHQIAALHREVVLLVCLQRDHDPSDAGASLVELRSAPAGDAT